ncbi:MAG: hypothetical protein ACUVRR_05455 [Candidatus Fervidibacter sp.]
MIPTRFVTLPTVASGFIPDGYQTPVAHKGRRYQILKFPNFPKMGTSV